MLKTRPTSTVALMMVLTIAAEIAFTAIQQKMLYARTPMDPSMARGISWTILFAGLVALVGLLGLRRERLWLFALAFFLGTFVGTIFVGQLMFAG